MGVQSYKPSVVLHTPRALELLQLAIAAYPGAAVATPPVHTAPWGQGKHCGFTAWPGVPSLLPANKEYRPWAHGLHVNSRVEDSTMLYKEELQYGDCTCQARAPATRGVGSTVLSSQGMVHHACLCMREGVCACVSPLSMKHVQN